MCAIDFLRKAIVKSSALPWTPRQHSRLWKARCRDGWRPMQSCVKDMPGPGRPVEETTCLPLLFLRNKYILVHRWLVVYSQTQLEHCRFWSVHIHWFCFVGMPMQIPRFWMPQLAFGVLLWENFTVGLTCFAIMHCSRTFAILSHHQ